MVWAGGKQAGQRPYDHAMCSNLLGTKKASDIVQLTEIIGLVKPAVLGLRILDSICRAAAAPPSSRPPATPVLDISSTLELGRSG
jgi:hypothetical protein